MNVNKYLDEKEVIAWRRHLHENPELSFKEYNTSAYIETELRKMGDFEITRPTPTSVLATINPNKEGKTIALRADIDALPITEESDVEFKSKNEGVMHACGHDTHAAMLLGAAKVLIKNKDELNGTIKLIFQHAEEVSPGGAYQIIQTHELDDIDEIYGLHIAPNEPTGTIFHIAGPMMAASDGATLIIQGRGSHGSIPEKSIDPVTIGAMIVININQIISRNVSAFDNAVISCGVIKGGTVGGNIIPDTAELKFTIRTLDENVRKLIEIRIREIIDGVCKAYGATYTLDYYKGYGVTENDIACVEKVKRAADKVVGKNAHFETKPAMASEDFSSYKKIAPTAFYILGGGLAKDGYGHIYHNPKFKVDEAALMTGVKMHVELACIGLE